MPKDDVLVFLRAWVANPGRVGAIAPSGAALARLMTQDITAASGPVIELGPGTGVFTRALLARGVPEKDLTLVEYSADLAARLRLQFPQARVLCMDAAKLEQSGVVGADSVGAVISGLPLLNLPRRKSLAILAATFGCMRPGGAFYQFTYGPRCPVPRPFLDRLGLKAVCLGRAFLNVPPAAVYRITRRPPSRLAPAPAPQAVS